MTKCFLTICLQKGASPAALRSDPFASLLPNSRARPIRNDSLDSNLLGRVETGPDRTRIEPKTINMVGSGRVVSGRVFTLPGFHFLAWTVQIRSSHDHVVGMPLPHQWVLSTPIFFFNILFSWWGIKLDCIVMKKKKKDESSKNI